MIKQLLEDENGEIWIIGTMVHHQVGTWSLDHLFEFRFNEESCEGVTRRCVPLLQQQHARKQERRARARTRPPRRAHGGALRALSVATGRGVGVCRRTQRVKHFGTRTVYNVRIPTVKSTCFENFPFQICELKTTIELSTMTYRIDSREYQIRPVIPPGL